MPVGDASGAFIGETWEATFQNNDLFPIYVEQVAFLDGWGWNPGANGTWIDPGNDLTLTMVVPTYTTMEGVGLVIANDSSWTGRADGVQLALEIIPEPATLGLFALLGGSVLWIRNRFMI